MEPNPPSWGRSWAQDKSNRAARSAVFREHSKWWTKIDTRLTCVSGEEGHINIYIGWLDFLVFFRTKLFSNAGYAANCTKCLEILLLLYKLHILESDQRKVFVLFRAIFKQLSLQKATFLCFLSNF